MRRKVWHVLTKNQIVALSDKLKIVNVFECGKSLIQIQSEFGLPESTFYKIIKSKVSIKSEYSEGTEILRGFL